MNTTLFVLYSSGIARNRVFAKNTFRRLINILTHLHTSVNVHTFVILFLLKPIAFDIITRSYLY